MYSVDANGTDPSSLGRAKAESAIGPASSGILVMLGYKDRKYPLAETSTLQGVDFAGGILNDISLMNVNANGGANGAASGIGLGSTACGQQTLWVTGYIQPWAIYVDGIPVYGSDFIGTGIEVEQNGNRL